MILLWDQDGIFCDFVRHSCEVFSKNYQEVLDNWTGNNIEDNLGVFKHEFWKKIDSIHDWWETIPPTEECIEFLKIASQYDSHICTSPASNPNCAAGKLRWLRKHTKFDRNVVITPQKWLCAGPGKVLIDDTDKQIDKFKQVLGSKTILYPRVWNSNKHLVGPNAMDWFKSELERIENEEKLG